MLHNTPIDILCIDETKLDETFPDALFRRDGNKKWGRKMVFIRKE